MTNVRSNKIQSLNRYLGFAAVVIVFFLIHWLLSKHGMQLFANISGIDFSYTTEAAEIRTFGDELVGKLWFNFWSVLPLEVSSLYQSGFSYFEINILFASFLTVIYSFANLVMVYAFCLFFTANGNPIKALYNFVVKAPVYILSAMALGVIETALNYAFIILSMPVMLITIMGNDSPNALKDPSIFAQLLITLPTYNFFAMAASIELAFLISFLSYWVIKQVNPSPMFSSYFKYLSSNFKLIIKSILVFLVFDMIASLVILFNPAFMLNSFFIFKALGFLAVVFLYWSNQEKHKEPSIT